MYWKSVVSDVATDISISFFGSDIPLGQTVGYNLYMYDSYKTKIHTWDIHISRS